MDNDLATSLLLEGGTLVILNMPPGTEFGIDLNTWNVGHKFKGIKMIPPGLHFVYFSATNDQGQVAPRTGFFHEFKRREVLLRHYDPTVEDLTEESADKEQLDQIRNRLRELDCELGPYPLDSWKNWISLVNSVTSSDLERVMPLNGRICSAPELVHDKAKPYKSSDVPREHDGENSSENLRLAEESMPKMILKQGTELRFSNFPTKPYREGATPAEITKCSLDSSYTLLYLTDKLSGSLDLLAELQLSFVCFLVGQVWEGWEYWKKLLDALCRGEDFLKANPELYLKLISILHFQIQKVPEDLFVDIVESNNFFAAALAMLHANIEDNASTLPKELLTKASKFKFHIKSKFKWNLSVEDDDDEPIVCENG